MKRQFYFLALLALAGVFAVAQNMPRQQQEPRQNPSMPQTQQQPPTADQDKTSTASAADVQSEIQAAIQKEPTLSTASINVHVTGKNVELSGTVPNRDAKNTAEQIAKVHSGGLGVKNHLKVGEGNPYP